MRKQTAIVCSIFAISLAASSCRKQRCGLPTDYIRQPAQISQAPNVDIFLDGTSSMKGFIVPGTASRYQQLLPMLETFVTRGWSGSHLQFYRFGSIIEDLPARTYLDSQRPQFYSDRRVFRETRIQNVIDRAVPSNLTLIVTDLFQTDVDVNLISSKIKEKYLAPGLAVGVLGFRSEFNGEIFDVGPNNYTFPYKSEGNNGSTLRPLYVLALGDLADISNFLHLVLKSNLGSQDTTRAVIFSPFITEHVASFDGSAITDISKLQEIRDLLPADLQREDLKQFRIMDSTSPLTSFSAKLDYKPLDLSVPVSTRELESEVTAFSCNGNTFQESVAAQRAVSIKEAWLNESTLDFKAEVVPAFLPGAGIYCFRITLFPKAYKTPGWFSEWNMSSEQVEAAVRKPEQFKGSTTFNLETFLMTLWSANVQLHRPKVAQFYCYIRKD